MTSGFAIPAATAGRSGLTPVLIRGGRSVHDSRGKRSSVMSFGLPFCGCHPPPPGDFGSGPAPAPPSGYCGKPPEGGGRIPIGPPTGPTGAGTVPPPAGVLSADFGAAVESIFSNTPGGPGGSIPPGFPPTPPP